MYIKQMQKLSTIHNSHLNLGGALPNKYVTHIPNLSMISFIPELILGICVCIEVTAFNCCLVRFFIWLIFWSHLAAILALRSLIRCKSSQWFCHVSNKSEPASKWFLVGCAPEYGSAGANCLTLQKEIGYDNLNDNQQMISISSIGT